MIAATEVSIFVLHFLNDHLKFRKCLIPTFSHFQSFHAIQKYNLRRAYPFLIFIVILIGLILVIHITIIITISIKEPLLNI